MARREAMHFMNASASWPYRPSVENASGVKCLHCSRQADMYLRFFCLLLLPQNGRGVPIAVSFCIQVCDDHIKDAFCLVLLEALDQDVTLVIMGDILKRVGC